MPSDRRSRTLRMNPNTARLYNFPGAKREDAIVSAALRSRSADRLWKGDWTMPAAGPLSTPFGVRRTRNGSPVGRVDILSFMILVAAPGERISPATDTALEFSEDRPN